MGPIRCAETVAARDSRLEIGHIIGQTTLLQDEHRLGPGQVVDTVVVAGGLETPTYCGKRRRILGSHPGERGVADSGVVEHIGDVEQYEVRQQSAVVHGTVGGTDVPIGIQQGGGMHPQRRLDFRNVDRSGEAQQCLRAPEGSAGIPTDRVGERQEFWRAAARVGIAVGRSEKCSACGRGFRGLTLLREQRRAPRQPQQGAEPQSARRVRVRSEEQIEIVDVDRTGLIEDRQRRGPLELR